MEDIKKVCKKRARDNNQDPTVPITPHSHVDRRLPLDDSPNTPKSHVFDPFAPGPEDKLNFAPYCWKHKPKLSRRLQFELCTRSRQVSEDLRVCEEESVFQSIYSSVMELVMAMQREGNSEGSSSYGFQTPIGKRVGGVGDICPGAPVKRQPRIVRSIDKRKCCRKLEF